MEKLTDAGSIPATSTRTPCDVITNFAGGVQVSTRVSSNSFGSAHTALPPTASFLLRYLPCNSPMSFSTYVIHRLHSTFGSTHSE